jgi:hypothetical protein
VVNLSIESKQFARLAAKLTRVTRGKTRNVLKEVARAFVKDCMKMTPPFGDRPVKESWKTQRDIGMAAIKGDLFGGSRGSQRKTKRVGVFETMPKAWMESLIAQRGGDCDFDGFPTTNGRGISPVAPNNVAFSVGGYSSGKSVCVYTPGNGFTCNTAIIAAWPLYDPTTVLTGVNYGFGDFSAYNAWNLGTVSPGQTVYVTCFYIVGLGLSALPAYIC